MGLGHWDRGKPVRILLHPAQTSPKGWDPRHTKALTFQSSLDTGVVAGSDTNINNILNIQAIPFLNHPAKSGKHVAYKRKNFAE